jgi:GNAT superfamily N-acetyltransferase
MRVDPEFQNQGIASRFTRAQFRLIKKQGRNWVGLNTLDSKKPKATFRVMEKLGFRVVDVQCDDVYWRRPKGVSAPRLQRHPDIYRHYRRIGVRAVFYERYGWLNCRLLPGRAEWLNRHGRILDGVPLVVIPRREKRPNGSTHPVKTIDLLDRPADFRTFVPRLLALVPQRGHLVVNYRSEWAKEFRAAARAAIPKLRQNHGTWQSTWRIYGKSL